MCPNNLDFGFRRVGHRADQSLRSTYLLPRAAALLSSLRTMIFSRPYSGGLTIQFRGAFTGRPLLQLSPYSCYTFHPVSAPRSCTRDEGRSLGAGLQGQAPNHLKLLWLNARVVSVKEKALRKVSGEVQGGERKRTADKVSKTKRRCRNWRPTPLQDKSRGNLLTAWAASGIKVA